MRQNRRDWYKRQENNTHVKDVTTDKRPVTEDSRQDIRVRRKEYKRQDDKRQETIDMRQNRRDRYKRQMNILYVKDVTTDKRQETGDNIKERRTTYMLNT
jgi:hypothetical protein